VRALTRAGGMSFVISVIQSSCVRPFASLMMTEVRVV